MSKYTIQDIFTTYGPKYIKTHNLSKEQWKVYNSIINCGTIELGYHICTCKECGEEYFGYNSCRNRHWIYVKFLDTIFCQNLPYLNLFQFPFDKHKYFYYSIVV